MRFKFAPQIEVPAFRRQVLRVTSRLIPRSRLRRFLLGSALSLSGFYLYTQVIDTKVDLVYLKNAQTEGWLRELGPSVTDPYRQSPQMPVRFLEIIYGNILDKRDYCSYAREIVYLKDGENIALGGVTRLAQTHQIRPRCAYRGPDSGADGQQLRQVHQVN